LLATEAFNAMSEPLRAALSHRLRLAQNQSEFPVLTTTSFQDFLDSWKLTTPAEQIRNLIEIIGDHLVQTGVRLPRLTPAHCARIGSVNIQRIRQILDDAETGGWIRYRIHSGGVDRLDLTLTGWNEYEANKVGLRPGNYGFIAMKFGDPILEELCRDVIKPKLKAALNIDVVDLRDVSRAGVIDNLMREQIREAGFVLVDLTHDNYGAYWEAGYAEGLGKPVIYLCEQSKFDEFKTHFDTNHLTTVTWDRSDDEAFIAQLTATLKRSLGLFA